MAIAALVALAALAGPQSPPPTVEPIAAELAEIQRQRARDPDDPVALEKYSTLLGRQGDADGQVAYLIAAIDALDRTEVEPSLERTKERELKRLTELMTKLDPQLSALRGYREDYLLGLVPALKLYARNQNKPRNALEIAGRILRFRPGHTVAEEIVEEIKKRKDPALLDEIQRIANRRELSRPRAFLDQWASQHGDWQRADRVETGGYVVRSDAGYDLLQRAARGLEWIARYYADFYGTNRAIQRGKTQVALCRTRDEWANVAQSPDETNNPGVLAFLSKLIGSDGGSDLYLEFGIFAFDPRDIGRPLESLWPSLWHEASHQYMHLRMKQHTPPAWLDEGMASYFEGAQVTPAGEILVGLPAMERLTDLVARLEAGWRPLAELLATPRLEGQHYPPAWGLVYYLRHGRDRIGRPLRDLLAAAVEQASKQDLDGTSLFSLAVLAPLQMELAAFESDWIAEMKRLFATEMQPRQCADEFLAIAEKECTGGHDDAALEAFRDALLRVPEDATALLGLARLQKNRSDRAHSKDDALRDATLTAARVAYHAAAIQGQGDLMQRAAAIATAVDPGGFKAITDAEVGYRKKVEGLVTKKRGDGRPKTALAIAGRFLDDVLADHRQSVVAAELRESGAFTATREIELFDGVSLAGLGASPTYYSVKDGDLCCTVARPKSAPLSVDRPLAPLFRFEGEVRLEDSNTMFAVCLSQAGRRNPHGYVVRPHQVKGLKQPEKRYLPFDPLQPGNFADIAEAIDAENGWYGWKVGALKTLPAPLEAGTWVRFRLVRDALGSLSFELDGRTIATRTIDAIDSACSVGLLVYGGTARLRNLKVIEIDRL